MSSLDEKLRDIIFKPGISKVWDGVAEEIIPQIKQAFADENYVQIPMTEVVTRYEAGKKPEVFMVNGKEVMTGQEWWNRFEKEFDKLSPLPKGMTERGRGIEAAKRAAGFEDDKENTQ